MGVFLEPGNRPIRRNRRWKIASVCAIGLLGACGEGGFAASGDGDTTAVTATQNMALGTNLDGLAYWSTALPTLDVMKSAGTWLPQTDGAYDTGEKLALDSNGWPLAPPDPSTRRYRSMLVNVIHDNSAAKPSAEYVVMYEGTGKLEPLEIDGAQVLSRAPGELHVRSGQTSGGLYLRIDAASAGADSDPVRNIRIVRKDYLPLYLAGLTFNPEFLQRINPFQVLRFMDWMNTNALFGPTGGPITEDAAIEAAPQLDWAHRPRPEMMKWGDGGRGVPVEALVEIANRTGAEPWFTMPINATDDYVRGFAQYVRDHLRPDLKIHVELSNEVWNWIFPQARYAQAQARKTFGPDGHWLEWYGMRAAQIGKIWKQVFNQPEKGSQGRGRVSMVFGTQFAWKGLESNGLETAHWRDASGNHIAAADYFDEYAITGYYDGAMNTDDSVKTVEGWWKDQDGGYQRAVAALEKRITDFNAPLYRYHAEQAKAHGLRLVSYESGFGEYTPISQHQNEAYTQFLIKLQRRPELTRLETLNYNAFAAAGGQLFMNFGIIGEPSKWGSWSALGSVNEAHSARYDALTAWLRAHPPAASRGPAVAFADARIAMGSTKGETLEETAHGYDVLVGGPGDDRFVIGSGNGGRIDGGGGTDTLVLPGKQGDWRFVDGPQPGQTQVTGPGGTRIVSRIARASFSGSAPISLAQLVSKGTAKVAWERPAPKP